MTSSFIVPDVILGVQSGDRNGRELNGVGKSTLIRLVDYAFIGTEQNRISIRTELHFFETKNIPLRLTFENGESQFQIRRKFCYRR